MPIAITAAPRLPIGKIKTFGAFGPKYEIGSPLRQLEDGDWLIEIKLIETGESVEYRLSHVQDDPDAR